MVGYVKRSIDMQFGRVQIAILRTVTPPGQAFICTRPSQYAAALKLNGRGYLDRDPDNRRRFIGNKAGSDAIIAHDNELERRIEETITDWLPEEIKLDATL